MSSIILITMALLGQYLFFSGSVGFMRGKKGIQAPATGGNDEFERYLRVQINTLEQLIVTIPALWICAIYFRIDVAAVLGVIFLIGRFIYAAAYIKNPPNRSTGMVIGFLANIGLILCCIYEGLARLF